MTNDYEILDENDPRAILAKMEVESLSETASAAPVLDPPIIPFIPLPSVVSVPSRGIQDSIPTEETSIVAMPLLEESLINPIDDSDPLVSYIGYHHDDIDKRIINHGTAHRSNLALYASLFQIVELDPSVVIKFTTRSAWDSVNNVVIELPDDVLSIEYNRFHAINLIDNQAENIRLKLITPGAGQALVYQGKKEEAARFLAQYPDHNDALVNADVTIWPLLNAEVPVTAPCMWLVAQTVTYLSSEWTRISALIETIRLEAKVAVGRAASVTEINSITSSITWPAI